MKERNYMRAFLYISMLLIVMSLLGFCSDVSASEWLDDKTVLLWVKRAVPIIRSGYGNLILMQYDIDKEDFCFLEDADGNQIEINGDTANVDIAVNRELRQIIIATCQHPLTQDDFMYANCELQYTLYRIDLNTGVREAIYETQPKRGICFGEYSKIRWL